MRRPDTSVGECLPYERKLLVLLRDRASIVIIILQRLGVIGALVRGIIDTRQGNPITVESGWVTNTESNM